MKADLNILIIEADPSILVGLEESINDLGFSFCCTATPNRPIHQLAALRPDLTIIGPSLETGTCMKCLHKLKTVDPLMPILTSCDEACLPKECACTPFFGIHYLGPNPDPDEILGAIENALKPNTEQDFLPATPILLIGQSQEIRAIRQKIQKVADKDVTVLITGETGSGKELIARSIHYHSLRKSGGLVKINCGALPDGLMESEVFGFYKGAFTGAFRDKPGRLEMARGGTLFVDEIGDLSLNLQVKFLQVLEDRVFSRLGGTEDTAIDTRIVAATNLDLQKSVREGTFRKDLFYRLNVVHIKAPPLRGRKNDIELLTDFFMNKYCFEFRKEPLDIPDKVLDVFVAYQWPGNVRELENLVRRAIVLRDWNLIIQELNLENLNCRNENSPVSEAISPHLEPHDNEMERLFRDTDFSLKKACRAYVSQVERKAILKILKETKWNRKKAAELLQVSYKTLLNRITEFDISP
ncbi:MAG: hypothetical protein BA872_01265 [Desulfobacterales bacterium C00003060]|nr:MAG: hypothetical protein BA872_01265 [Desulfobacterales bacterium C00003060]OEU80723.1 MAG: hypothetical protein BA865_06525 [Desulfobacterales bacterium S5133MH4]